LATKQKIKILDDNNFRAEIDELYELTDQVDLAKWSISIAKHILHLLGIDYNLVNEIVEGFHSNELWQQYGNSRIQDVRKSGFAVHRLARETDNEIYKTALRAVGQAISSAHMREHSMVASDYATKVIGLLTSNDINAISNEREWQFNELKRVIKKNKNIL